MAIGLNSLLIESSNDLTTVMNNRIENTSLTNYTIAFLTEMYNDFREADKQMYKSIYEADSLVAVNESFSDFFVKIKEIIKKFLKYIKSLFDRFITTLHRIVNSEKYLLKKEDVLRRFSSEHEFDFDGYEFTIEPNVPICNALVEFNDTFVGLDLSDIGSNQKDNKDVIKRQYDRLKDEIDGSKYDKLRGEVIGKETLIYQSDFASELFETFRDGADSSSIFTVTNSIVSQCFKDMKDYKSVEKDTKKKKKEIENQYKEIEKQIDRMISTERTSGGYKVKIDGPIKDTNAKTRGNDGIVLDNSAMNQLNLYVKLLTNQITEMTTIHSMAFSHKLDALKDKYTQDKRILYIALSKIEKDKELRGEI